MQFAVPGEFSDVTYIEVQQEALDFNKSNDAIGEYKDKDAIYTICTCCA